MQRANFFFDPTEDIPGQDSSVLMLRKKNSFICEEEKLGLGPVLLSRGILKTRHLINTVRDKVSDLDLAIRRNLKPQTEDIIVKMVPKGVL